MSAINQKLTDLFESLGLSGLSDEEKQKYMADWSGMVQDRISMRIADGLSEEDAATLETLEGDAFDAFVAERVPNFDDIVVEETMSFREGLLSDANFIRGKLSEGEQAAE